MIVFRLANWRRWSCCCILLIGLAGEASAQGGGNPFELSPRLGKDSVAAVVEDTAEVVTPAPAGERNPFDIDRQPAVAITKPAEDRSPGATEGEGLFPIVRRPTTKVAVDPEMEAGVTLALVLLVVLLTALSLILFRSLYGKAYRAVFNDNMLSQLYREREAGAFGIFAIGYFIFFLSAGLFLHLLVRHYEWLPQGRPLLTYLLLTGGLFVVFLLKHLALSLIGAIFPVNKETSRYSFTIMVFAIVLSLILAPGSLLLAYIPPDGRDLVIYGVGGLIALLYLLRSLRGLFIANRFVFGHKFHFLLYICTVEIVPVLFLYKLLANS